MKVKNLSIVWIAIGFLELYLGVNGYFRYASGGLYIYEFPPEQEIKNIIFGLLLVYIGLGLIKFPAKQVKFVYAYYGWVMMFSFIGWILNIFDPLWTDTEMSFIIELPIVILVFITLSKIKAENIIEKIDIRLYFKKNWKFFLLFGLSLNFLIYFLAWLLPYEAFY